MVQRKHAIVIQSFSKDLMGTALCQGLKSHGEYTSEENKHVLL